MPGVPAPLAYRLKVSLRHVSPMIWRHLLVPSELTLYGLHRSVQIAFGWEDYHLHAFRVHGRRYGTEWTGQRHYFDHGEVDGEWRELTLADLSLRLRQKLGCEYDFGDSWEHEIRVEGREDANSGKPYPVCIGGGRAGPPEDIGGPDGYGRLLERLEDVRPERHYGTYRLTSGNDDEEEWSEEDEWALAWRNGFDGSDDALLRYDPSAFDHRAVNAELKHEFAPRPGEHAANTANQAEGP